MKITIITACINSKNVIDDCIKSVHAQTHESIEHIIVDGGSSDGTLDIINRYRDRISALISENDKGIYFALNKGLGCATGDIIGFLNADDILIDRNVLADIAGVFSDEKIDSCYADLYYVRQNNTDSIIRTWRSRPYEGPGLFRKGWMPPHPTFYARRDIYRQYGGFDVTYAIAADYEIMLRFLFKHGISSYHLPRVILKMRRGGISNKNLRHIVNKTAEDYRICKKYGMGAGTVLMKNITKISQFL